MQNYFMANYHSEYFWLFMAMGAFAGIVVFSLVKRIICRIMKIGKSHFNLEKVILWISFVGAVMCLVLSLLGEQTVSIQILSFYVSFIFAWLLTKGSSQKDFKRMQHKIAKNTYRHIEDVETTVLITKSRIEELCGKEEVSQGELQGIVDDLNSILTGIRSNKDDWKDMLKKSYRTKIDNQDDPEGRLEKLKSPPNSAEIKEVFKDEIKNNNTLQV
ncbi:MAG: hypothetical protein HFG99_08165 [Dorea sp.]|jgi:hypothetical protein|nr:hypothetical protein [Dorea sp.]